MITPGTRLKQIIPDFFRTAGCGCEGYARKLDAWGAAGCEERFDEIVEYLTTKAAEIGWLSVAPSSWLRFMARRWVRRAIDDSTKKPTP